MASLATLPKKSRIFVYLAIACISAVLIKLLWEYLQRKLHWWPQHWGAVDVLAVIAIAFAVVQFLDARQEENAMTQQEDRLRDITSGMEKQHGNLTQITQQMSDQTSDLRDIADSISTAYAGSFPDYLSNITEVINRAKHSLKIMVDFAGYGQYSAPDRHRCYVNAIEAARRRGVDVQLMCYNEELTTKERSQQFPDNGFTKKDDQKFRDFFRFRNTPPVSDFAQLRKILTDQDDTTRSSLGNVGVSLRYQRDPAAFFLWVIDDHAEAVFAFKNLNGERDTALSFKTRDGNLVRQFRDIFEPRWENAKSNYKWTEPTKTESDADSIPHADSLQAHKAAKSTIQ